jgi:hypothetical protein
MNTKEGMRVLQATLLFPHCARAAEVTNEHYFDEANGMEPASNQI